MTDNVTWAKAEAAYRTKGMSEKEIKAHKKAWMKKKDMPMKPTPEMLGKGMAAGAAKTAVSRKSKLERLAAELEGKAF